MNDNLINAKEVAVARRKHSARCAAIELTLSKEAKLYLRRNPELYENLIVLEALEFMDGATEYKRG